MTTTDDIRERIAAARAVGATAVAVEIEWVTKTEDRSGRLLEEIELTRRALGGRFCVSHRDGGQQKTHKAAAAAIACLTEAEGEISSLVWDRDEARDEVALLARLASARGLAALRDSRLQQALAERDEARAEAEHLRRHVEELQAKIDADRSCACSYDAAGDVCAHHSPALTKAEAEVEQLRHALSRLYDVMPDCDGGEAGEACRLARLALKAAGTGGRDA